MSNKNMDYIVSISGGKDSSAIAVWFIENTPEDTKSVHFIFADTGIEPSSTYRFLDRLEKRILLPNGYKLVRVSKHHNDYKSSWASLYNPHNKAPSMPGIVQRSCTERLKIIPMRNWRKSMKFDRATWVIGFRSDEGNKKRRLTPDKIIDGETGDTLWYPFIKRNIGLPQVVEILMRSGLGIPEYYKWTTRSGCALCFFKPRKDIERALTYEPGLYLDMEKLEEKNMLYHGDKKARADHCFVFEKVKKKNKDGSWRIARKRVRIEKKPLTPNDVLYNFEVDYFGRKASPYIATSGATLKQIRLGEEGQPSLFTNMDERNCGDPFMTCDK